MRRDAACRTKSHKGGEAYGGGKTAVETTRGTGLDCAQSDAFDGKLGEVLEWSLVEGFDTQDISSKNKLWHCVEIQRGSVGKS